MTNEETGAVCPFCRAPWSERMHAAYEAAIIPGAGCACCGDVPLPVLHKPAPTGPQDDLKCDACGRVIFRAVAIS